MKKSTTDEKQLKQTILELAREMGKDKEGSAEILWGYNE